MPKPKLDGETRAKVLEVADRPVSDSQGEAISVLKAVLLKQASMAMKGNAQAQKDFLERALQCKTEHDAEQAATSATMIKYKEVMTAKLAAGQQLPEDVPHPDDVVIMDGRYVGTRGENPAPYALLCANVVRRRDLYILQAELDYRVFPDPTNTVDDPAQFWSFLLAMLFNETLPDRFKLDNGRLLMRQIHARRIKKRHLIRQIQDGCAELGEPDTTRFPPIPLVGETWNRFKQVVVS
jgi:hypothetical protein